MQYAPVLLMTWKTLNTDTLAMEVTEAGAENLMKTVGKESTEVTAAETEVDAVGVAGAAAVGAVAAEEEEGAVGVVEGVEEVAPAVVETAEAAAVAEVAEAVAVAEVAEAAAVAEAAVVAADVADFG